MEIKDQRLSDKNSANGHLIQEDEQSMSAEKESEKARAADAVRNQEEAHIGSGEIQQEKACPESGELHREKTYAESGGLNCEKACPEGGKLNDGELPERAVQKQVEAIAGNGANRPGNPVMLEHTPYFLAMALIYSICFAASFYKSYAGIMFPLITGITLTVCGLFLKKSKLPWKKSGWWYVCACLLLGISTFLTEDFFLVFFNTVGILLLITVCMVRQLYDDKGWNFGQYLVNLLFLYLNMIPELASPFLHLCNHLKNQKKKEHKNKAARYVFLGVLMGLPMMALVIELLSSADQIFSSLIGELFHKLWSQVVFSPNVFLVVLLMLLGFFGIYSFLSALALRNMPEWKIERKRSNPLIAVTFLSMVTVVYVIFCVIQALFLFTGGMLLPEGYTYAEYAHQGFFQLLFVCIFNLILVVSCLAVFEMNKILQALLLLCSGCTYVMIASCALRMMMYISTYHLSFLRILVLWFLVMLVFLMAGVIAAVVRREFVLFRYCMAVVAICYLVFSLGRPSVLVAKYNVAQMGDDIGYEDLRYLSELSPDTIPVLAQYEFKHENCVKDEGTYNKEYDYYIPAAVWRYDGTKGRSVAVRSCRRCLLNQKLHQSIERAEHMDARTFHLSRYLAARAAKAYFAKF